MVRRNALRNPKEFSKTSAIFVCEDHCDMSGEIEVPETPNWLNDLEAKREKRLKARLGHEAGAGAPCLKCGDKCPGLDLHFWRKACKVCRCPKEEHDVPDDDIYGWAQFQLLGSKPNKIKTKIVLPGKNDEVELEWAPKGQKETIDKYLKSLPPEALTVKGSQAAQERKQLLQKQIPVHDIDPTLCHELNEEEVKKMEEYIAHIKKSSVGVGQIVNLSNVIKANLHNISPQEAHIIASRYSKGVPFSEIVKLEAGLAKNLENLALKSPKINKKQSTLPTLQPSKLPGNIIDENMQNALPTSKFKDITHPWYTNASPTKGLVNPRFSERLKPTHGDQNSRTPKKDSDYTINEKLFQGTNFDPSKTPSQFLGYHTSVYKSGRPIHGPNSSNPDEYENVSNQTPSSASHGPTVDKSYKTGPFEVGEENFTTSVPHGNVTIEQAFGVKPNYSQNLTGARRLQDKDQYGFENPYFSQNRQDPTCAPNDQSLTPKELPQYSPAKHTTHSKTIDPKAPKSFRDLIYSTYDPSGGPVPEDLRENSPINKNVGPKGVVSHASDPNAICNTYKHDPSVINHDRQTLEGSNRASPYDHSTVSPASNKGVPKFGPATGKYISEDYERSPGIQSPLNRLPKFDPISGKPIPEDQRYPATGSSVTRDNQYPVHESIQPKFDPVTGKYIQEGDGGVVLDTKTGRYVPEEDSLNAANRFGQPKFDPVTGKYIPQAGERIIFDPKTGKYVSEDGDLIAADKFGPPKFDPETGKYIPGYVYPKAKGSESRDPYGSQERGIFDPKTGRYASEDGNRNVDNKFGQPKFDHVTGKYIPEEQSYLESGGGISRDPYAFEGKEIFDPKTGRYISDNGNPAAAFSPNKTKKPLSAFQPGHINVPEDYLEPRMVNVGPIQDINPEIKAATTEFNPGFDKDSVYSDSGSEYSPESIREILNNIKLPDCHYCKKPFDENEFAVTIDRANVLFHAQCFKCAGCNQSLADNIYFYHKESNNVYCGRDYAKIKGYPRCSACDELIFTKEYCLAENSTFHLKHFCCFQCDTPLAGQDYTLEDDKPYCLPCYETSKAAKCSTCEKVIKPDEVGCQLNGVHFHAEDRCFRCIVCSVPLMGKKLLLRNEKLYCSHQCFNSKSM